MDVVDIITNLGFPAGVAAFALWNSYKHEQFLQDTLKTTITANTESLDRVRDAIMLLKTAVDQLNEKVDARGEKNEV